VDGDRPEIALVKAPVPLPSVVLESDVVGLEDVDQQTPRAVTEALPSLVTLPPPEAEFEVTEEGAPVVTVGGAPVVVKEISLPYAVPSVLVA
jgi:hypothetical protein